MRPVEKKFFKPKEKIKQLIPNMGGCMATDRIMVDGAKVGYMYREKSKESWDSGWVFMAGDESQEYADDPSNWAFYEVNTVANYDDAILLYLNEPPGFAWGRVTGKDIFEREEIPPDPE